MASATSRSATTATCSPSPPTRGFREYTLHVKDLRREDVPETVENVLRRLGGRQQDALLHRGRRGQAGVQLYRHALGADRRRTRSSTRRRTSCSGRRRALAQPQGLFLVASSHTAESGASCRRTAGGAFTIDRAAREGHEYAVDHRGGLFYIRTNKGGRNFRLVTAPVEARARTSWKELLAYRPAVMVSGLDLFADYAVVSSARTGCRASASSTSRRRRSTASSSPSRSTRSGREQPGVRHAAFRFGYQSFMTPQSVFDYDMATRSASS